MKILSKLKSIIKINRQNQEEILKNVQELNWANSYHDNIRGEVWISKLSLNIGRWAGSYSFFYILNIVLKNGRPNSILELGVGESTKFISEYLRNDLIDTVHQVVEHNDEWRSKFLENFHLSPNSKISYCPLITEKYKNEDVICYKGLDGFLERKYDLYVVDGPIGTKRFSRIDILKIARTMGKSDEFILIVDDVHRDGEKETVKEIMKIFKEMDLKLNYNILKGLKDVLIIGTENYMNSIQV